MSLRHWLGLTPHRPPLSIGASLPEVQVHDQDGKLVALHELGRTGWLFVYFYPKADTPGCTAQACSLRDHHEQILKEGVRIIGISTDKLEKQKSFHQKYNLPFLLLSDPKRKAIRAFGVHSVFKLSSRQAYLFYNGTLVWRDLGASTARQGDDLLHVLNQIKPTLPST